MKIHPSKSLVIVIVLAASVVAAFVFSARREGATLNRNGELERVLLDPNTRIDQALRTAGFPQRFVDVFSSVTTEVVSSANGRYHIVQRMPALSLRRDVRIAIHTGKRLTPGPGKAVRTAAGFDVYPLHHAVVRIEGGYDRYQAFFVEHDALGNELLNALGVQRQAKRRDWNILPVVHAQQSAMLGIVVASVTTTTTGDSGGIGDTFRPAPEGGMDSGSTHPSAESAGPGMESVEARRQLFLDENYNGSQEAYNQQYQENQRRFTESLDAETRARLQQPENLSLESAQAEIELRNLLRDGETLAQREARVALERDAARLQRIGNALSVLQALAEWMQQALDFGEWDRQLAAAEACLDRRARNAGPEERANIEQVRAHLEAARSDMNWNTGVRVVNSGNTAASAAVPAGLVAGGVFGLASSGNNAGLRDLTAQSVAAALGAVGNCEPPPCAEPQRDGPPTQELTYTPAEQQTYTPGPDRRPESACRERWTGSTRLTIPEGPTFSAGLVWEYTETHGSLVSYKAVGELTYTPPATQSGCRVVSVTPRIHQLAPEDAFLTIDVKSLEYSTSGASGWPATECIQCWHDTQPRCSQTMIGNLWLQGSGLAVRSGNGMTIRESAPFMGGTLSYTFEHR